MATKIRNTKTSSRTKNTRSRPAVKVGGKKRRSAWYRRGSVYAVALLVGIVGCLLLLLTRASTAPNCTSVSSSDGSTMSLCSTVASNNYISGIASYVGGINTNRLSSGSVTLFACDKTSLACNPIASNSKVTKVLFQPGKASVKTSGVAYTSTMVYKSCVSFTDSVGWQNSNVCTALVDFGAGYGSNPVVYTPPTTTTGTTTATGSGSGLDCGGDSPTKSDGTPWTCTLDDEFNGTSLNRSVWVPQTTSASGFATTDTGDGNARACFVDNENNISVANGVLSLTARQEPAAFTCTSPSGSFSTSYTSGEVTTYKTFSQQYGRFDISAKLPAVKVKGLQETLWLWPNSDTKYGRWPASGEMDLAEFYSLYPTYNVPYIHYNYSSYDTASDTNIVTLISPKYNKNYYNCVINYDAFNTYSAIWRSGYIEYDVNGKPCVVDNYISTAGAVPAPFDQPFFAALTQNLGIKSGGADNAFVVGTTPLPATTQIDYVRVWK